jgi:hypothetical protein
VAQWTAKQRRRALTGGAALLTLCAFVAVVGYTTRSEAPTSQQATQNESSAAKLALAKVKASVDNPRNRGTQTKHTGDHESHPALNFSSTDDFRWNARWFDGGERSTDGKFTANHTPLKFESTCKPYSESSYTNLESAVARDAQFDPTQVTPLDIQVQELSQFWRIGNTYFKLTGRWERDQPATFRANLFSAASADFENNLRVMPLPEGLAVQTDVLSLSESMEREVERSIAIGGIRGARLTQVFYPGASGQETHEVKLHNGRPVSWSFGHGRCQLREQGDAYCRCVPQHINEKKPTSDQPSVDPPQKQTKENQNRVQD